MNLDPLIKPTKVYSRAEVLTRPSPVPPVPGIYAWYFREIPTGITLTGCVTFQDLSLLYIGISPRKPPTDGKPRSKGNLNKRIPAHFKNFTQRSTLRRTLGCLLADHLNLQLRYVGSGKSISFCAGEEKLSHWMSKNAFVTWMPCQSPWAYEAAIIKTLMLPFNLDYNEHNPNHPFVSGLRQKALDRAKQLPIVPRRTL